MISSGFRTEKISVYDSLTDLFGFWNELVRSSVLDRRGSTVESKIKLHENIDYYAGTRRSETKFKKVKSKT